MIINACTFNAFVYGSISDSYTEKCFIVCNSNCLGCWKEFFFKRSVVQILLNYMSVASKCVGNNLGSNIETVITFLWTKQKQHKPSLAPLTYATYFKCRLDVLWSLASSVLTRPNSCITLSSWRKSSWPFNRYMNSAPLLPCKTIKEIVKDKMKNYRRKRAILSKEDYL